ncbi:MAG TPA: J domain-containing protein [Chloroflexi bacterium]|nr:J domain-containing protein [Chloroflexota bacterium]
MKKALPFGVDPYQVLGVSPQATEAEIKRAYFRKVREHPPERDPEAFKRIRAAYEMLKDPQKRALVQLLTVQPPPPLSHRRKLKPDLNFHPEDVLRVLKAASDLERTDFSADFEPINL